MANLKNKNTFKKVISIIILSITVFVISGCQPKTPPKPQVTLTYYKLFENSESLRPVINAFQQANPHIKIEYKKFTDPESYEKLLLSEFAEGEGPDIFSMPASWVKNNTKKIQPAPTSVIPLEAYENTFLTFINDDLVLTNPETGEQQAYGVPLAIDTLALFYNQDHYDRRLPEQGKPSTTWDAFTSDVRQLRSLNDDNQLLRAATALGRTDNASYGFDIWLNLLTQNSIDLFNRDQSKAIFANNKETEELTDFYTSFATKGSATYTWDQSTQTVAPTPLELFATGRLSTLFGYSFTYKQILDQITISKRDGQQVIDPSSIKIAPLPQSSTNPDDYQVVANYFAETVSRTSTHPTEAWTFLRFLVQAPNLQSFYNEGGFKVSPRRDMISTQEQSTVYKAFVDQLSYAKPINLIDKTSLEKHFNQAITNYHQGTSLVQMLRDLQSAFDQVISLTAI